MANHGWVKTRKQMTPAQITAMLEELNVALFKGNLQIEYDGTWLLTYVSQGQEWARRLCWLETSRHFEMRHGNSGKLDYWIDTAIINEVAVRFDGTIGDDGISDRWKGEAGKFNSFAVFMERSLEHVKGKTLKAEILKLELVGVPPEFRDEIAVRREVSVSIQGELHGQEESRPASRGCGMV